MTLLEELNTLLTPLVPVETGVFSDTAPDCYAVLTPLSDSFGFHADDQPHCEVQEVRLSLFDKGNYTQIKHDIVQALLYAGITITDRRYIGHEDDTGYHHIVIDVAKEYEFEMEDIDHGNDWT